MDEQEDYEEQKDHNDHENEEKQHSTILFTPKQLEVLLKMNRLNFPGLVEAFKGGSSKNVGFKPTKLENLMGARLKGCGCLACRDGKLPSCCQSLVAIWVICSILPKGLCFRMVEDGETRGRENPWLHMRIIQGTY